MSCLFQSLAYFVQTDDPHVIRQKICNYLVLDQKISFANATDYVQWEYNMDLVSYVSRMRQPQVWGSSIELQCFCELYNYAVTVTDLRQPSNNTSFTFMPTRKNQGALKFAQLTWNGGHYEAIK